MRVQGPSPVCFQKDMVILMDTPEDKRKRLLFQQKDTMDKMLAAGALSKEQYEFSLNGLIEKMGFDKDVLSKEENYRSKI